MFFFVCLSRGCAIVFVVCMIWICVHAGTQLYALRASGMWVQVYIYLLGVIGWFCVFVLLMCMHTVWSDACILCMFVSNVCVVCVCFKFPVCLVCVMYVSEASSACIQPICMFHFHWLYSKCEYFLFSHFQLCNLISLFYD